MRMKSLIQCIVLQLVLVLSGKGQETARVRGHFESDSIRIGEAVPFSLTASYPSSLQVLFPDTTFSFAPFEIQTKKFFTTKTSGATSYDSAVYLLTTFEIDSIQRLSLPAFVLQKSDCVAVFSDVDSIFLSPRVKAVPDSVSVDKLPLKTNTAYQRVQWILNYPIALITLGVLGLALVACWFIFGKRIRKYFALRKLNRNYTEFIASFTGALDKLNTGFSSRNAEAVLAVWKRYMEGLEQHPYTKETSREIIRRISDHNLDNALKTIDRGIYGGLESTLDPYRFLQAYSRERFQKKEEEVKNG